jgi:hypothetical protein
MSKHKLVIYVGNSSVINVYKEVKDISVDKHNLTERIIHSVDINIVDIVIPTYLNVQKLCRQ